LEESKQEHHIESRH